VERQDDGVGVLSDGGFRAHGAPLAGAALDPNPDPNGDGIGRTGRHEGDGRIPVFLSRHNGRHPVDTARGDLSAAATRVPYFTGTFAFSSSVQFNTTLTWVTGSGGVVGTIRTV
jgi:hypothetical protein